MSLAFQNAEKYVWKLVKSGQADKDTIWRQLCRAGIRQGEFHINQVEAGLYFFGRQEPQLDERKVREGISSSYLIFPNVMYHELYLGTLVLPRKYIDLSKSRTLKKIDNLAIEKGLRVEHNRTINWIGLVGKDNVVEATIKPSCFLAGEGNAQLFELIGKQIYGLSTSNILTLFKSLFVKVYYPDYVWEQVRL